MNFFRQILFEARNFLRNKFLLIVAIILLAVSAAAPALSLINKKDGQTPHHPVVYRGGVGIGTAEYARGPGRPKTAPPASGQQGSGAPARVYTPETVNIRDWILNKEKNTLEIDGTVFDNENQFYWELQNEYETRESLDIIEQGGIPENYPFGEASDNALPMIADLNDIKAACSLTCASNISGYEDYRYEVCWDMQNTSVELYMYRYDGGDYDALYEAFMTNNWSEKEDFMWLYRDISDEDRAQAIADREAKLDSIKKIISGDFTEYISYKTAECENDIESMKNDIDELNKQIADNPKLEASLQENIKNDEIRIATLRDNRIPILQYRLEKNIRPNDGSWQDNALNDAASAAEQLNWQKPVSEKEFLDSEWMKRDYGSYPKYLEAMKKETDRIQERINAARKSLENEDPDMRYVPNGARAAADAFLPFSLGVAMLGILIGGTSIAGEFQSGTVRLLLIRPRTRTKVFMARYIAAVGITLAVLFSGSILNLLSNGIFRGFADYGFHNYTVTSGVGFLSHYLPRILACGMTALFACTLAFALSAVVRNTAVSISIPIIAYVGELVISVVFAFASLSKLKWIIYTPFAYMDVSSYYAEHSAVSMLMNNGVGISAGLAVGVLAVLTALLLVFSLVNFRRRDILN